MSKQFEEHLMNRLSEDLKQPEAEAHYRLYQNDKEKLTKHIYAEIKGVQEDRSDHGADHVDHVLGNVRYLITDDYDTHGLSGIELYLLGISVLWHDVGNLFGRAEHNRKISEVFDWVRGTDAAFRREKALLQQIIAAHTGVASDGTADTLKELSDSEHLENHPIRLQKLAAILRFADELAEGPRRTSEFMRTHFGYDSNSQFYHDYASSVHIHIDRSSQRIQLTYEIDVAKRTSENKSNWTKRLREFIQFVYRRIIKLDQERRYVRYYSSILQEFDKTSVEFNFWCNNEQLPPALPSLLLDDKVVPGMGAQEIEKANSDYRLAPLVKRLQASAEEVPA